MDKQQTDFATIMNAYGSVSAVKFSEDQPTNWPDFVKRTVAHAQEQVADYEQWPELTRAEWALSDAEPHRTYTDWRRVIAEFQHKY